MYGDQEVDIGQILLGIRKDKKAGLLTDAQITLLEMFGIVWAPKDKEIVYAGLIKYKELYGSIANIRSDQKLVVDNVEYPVGKQINNIRTKYNKGLYNDDEIAFFEDLGMVWNKRGNHIKSADSEKTQ